MIGVDQRALRCNEVASSAITGGETKTVTANSHRATELAAFAVVLCIARFAPRYRRAIARPRGHVSFGVLWRRHSAHLRRSWPATYPAVNVCRRPNWRIDPQKFQRCMVNIFHGVRCRPRSSAGETIGNRMPMILSPRRAGSAVFGSAFGDIISIRATHCRAPFWSCPCQNSSPLLHARSGGDGR